MSSLLPDLTPDILSYLPVKDLLRFRCVCSSWRSLIDSPYFAKLHLSRSEKTGSNLFLLDIDKGRIISLGSLEKLAPEICELPLIQSRSPVHIAGSCNGVVALYNLYGGEDVSLWNPSTRKLRELPSSKITAEKPGLHRFQVAHGFGYDSAMDDYKLVRIAKYIKDSLPPFFNVEVYSLKMNSWTEIECPYPVNFCTTYTCSEAFVNNALHWTSYSRPVTKIVAFDLVKEEFYLVPHPDCNHEYPAVGELGGCLSMSFNHISSDFGLHVWVMDKYMVKESWSKILFLPPIETRKNPSFYVTPIAYSKDRRKILLRFLHDLSWYDPVTEKLDFLDELECSPCGVIESAMCTESLIALEW